MDNDENTKDETDENVKSKQESNAHDTTDEKAISEDQPPSEDQPKSDDSKTNIDLPELDQASVKVVVEEGSIEIDTAEQEKTVHTSFRQLYTSNKGAVVALSLGLVITAMLLIFVGFRLRNVKKRLRRGRPLNSNEAEVLSFFLKSDTKFITLRSKLL